MVEHHGEDDHHDIAHHALLSLLIGHLVGVFRPCGTHALLNEHHATENDGQEVEIGAKEEDGVMPGEDHVGRGEVVDPAGDETDATELKGRFQKIEHPDEEGHLDQDWEAACQGIDPFFPVEGHDFHLGSLWIFFMLGLDGTHLGAICCIRVVELIDQALNG